MPSDRHHLGAAASALLAQRGSAGERRVAALQDALRFRPAPALSLDDLATLPDWMGAPRALQSDIARRVALVSMGEGLSRSIDGGWLKALADVAGEEAVDWAVDAAEAGPTPSGSARLIAAEQLTSFGFGLAATTLPAALRPLLAWAEPADISPDLAEAADGWIAAAQDAVA